MPHYYELRRLWFLRTRLGRSDSKFNTAYHAGAAPRFTPALPYSTSLCARCRLAVHCRTRRYYNDLWELNLETMKWTSLGPGPGTASAALAAAAGGGAGGPWPSPRSGCGMTVVGDTLWVFGGYSKVSAVLEWW